MRERKKGKKRKLVKKGARRESLVLWVVSKERGKKKRLSYKIEKGRRIATEGESFSFCSFSFFFWA